MPEGQILYSPAMFGLSPKDNVATEFINSVVTQAHRVRQVHEDPWQEAFANYMVEPYTRQRLADRVSDPYYYEQRRSLTTELKVPESHQIANTLTSIIMASVYGVRDYVRAEPTGGEDLEASRKVSQLVMFGLERPGGYRTDYEQMKDATIFGTGAEKIAWRTQIRTVPRRLPVAGPDGMPLLDPDTGLPITLMQNITAPVYDDITRLCPSLYDIWFDPGATRIDNCLGVVERSRIGSDVLRGMIGLPGWIESGIRQVLALKPSEWAPGPGQDDSPKLTIMDLTKDDVRHIAAFGYRGSWTYTGMLPSEVAEGLDLDPMASAVLTIINGILVQADQNPQRNGELPYDLVTILPTGGDIYGLSPLQVVRYLQDVADTQLILTVQAALEAVYQNYVVGGGAGVGPGFFRQLERRKPREVFSVPGDVSQVQPLLKDYTGLQIASGMLLQMSQMMRNASSARDPVQGQATSSRQTATEINTIASSALQNVDQLSALIEREDLPRKGRLVADEYYIHLEDEGRVIRRAGADMSDTIAFSDIDLDYDVTFVGARLSLSKQAKANVLRDFAQVMLSNPLTAASFDALEFAKMYADHAADIRGLDRLIITDPEELAAKIQLAGQKGIIGGGAGGTAPAGTEGEMPPAQAAGESS